MEWLEFKPWSAEVTEKMVALNPSSTHPKALRARVLPFRAPLRPSVPARWDTMLQQWPQHSLWGHWVDAEK